VRIPVGYEQVDPRTARRVPLTMSLRDGVPLYPGDPPFAWEVATDTREAGGYLVERVTSLGTHTATHVSAPAHLRLDGPRLSEIGEQFVLMPLVVLDLRERIAAEGPDFFVIAEDLESWEGRHGPIPAGGCVLLLTGAAALFDRAGGAQSPYVTAHVPGLAGAAVDWLFEARGIVATGSDTLGPDATIDAGLQATARTLAHGGVTLENVGPQLPRMRPHGDWLTVNGNRPAFGGFPMGLTGFTVPNG
jgi:kynurenine formamidase